MSDTIRFPDARQLLSLYPEVNVLNVNSHIHTPSSFSAFTDIAQIFSMAADENIACLGINDFFVTDGYDSFHRHASATGVFPLFNIEFIALLREEQRSGIRINDPANPGRCYFCGKGLDYPFHLNETLKVKLDRVVSMSQEQVRAMIVRLNDVFARAHSDIRLDYNSIQKELAENLVRERHLAKAVRLAVFNKFSDDGQRKSLLTEIFGNKPVESALSDVPALENEIRSCLLKAGGRAFVEEDEDTFMNLDDVTAIIRDAGGIPCYPVLLDDKKGNYTEFEQSPEKLCKELLERNICCIELIPGRNDAGHLERFVNYFNERQFVILMGTEHNTPEMIPLTCDTRGKVPLSPGMRKISFEGACIIAAHQFLRARGFKGFSNSTTPLSPTEKEYFISLGNAAIHFRYQKNHHSS